jgi:hypothetical protein
MGHALDTNAAKGVAAAMTLLLSACGQPPQEATNNAAGVDKNLAAPAPVTNVDENLTTFDMNAEIEDAQKSSSAEDARTEEARAEDVVKIDDWSWETDPDFGTEGAIKWRVSVRNLSDRPIASAKVEFSAYDDAHHLLTTTFTYVEDIPPGETRDEESFADYHGGEKSARAVIAEVRFDD